MIYVVIALAVIVVILLIANVRIVPQSEAHIVERLGAYCATWDVGVHLKVVMSISVQCFTYRFLFL